MYKNHSTSTFINTVDKNGVLDNREFVERTIYKPNGKQGWVKMYRNGYDKVMLSLTSRLEMVLFIHIRDSFTKHKELVGFNQTKIAEKFGSTRPTVNRLFRKLIKNNFIRKTDGVYRMNPYIFAPYHTDLDGLQGRWDDTEQIRKFNKKYQQEQKDDYTTKKKGIVKYRKKKKK